MKNIIRFSFSYILFAMVGQNALGGEVGLKLSTTQQRCQLGSTIRFNVVYTNNSNSLIRLLPQTEGHLTDIITAVDRDGQQAGTVVANLETSVDFEELSKGAVLLKPGHSVDRALTAKLVQVLPKYFDLNSKGLFLVFRGTSALRLPRFGKYWFTAYYESRPDNPVKRYLPKGPSLWEGTARSAPLAIEFVK